MKKILLTLASAALATLASAQVSVQQPTLSVVETSPVATQYNQARKVAKIADNQRWLGYYNSDALAQNGMGVPSYPGNNKAAILLTEDMLKPYVGKQIVAIRFGLCAAVGDSRVFIDEFNGQGISDDVVSVDALNTVVGWNEIALTTPYTITSGGGLLVGYDYTQLGDKQNEASYPFSSVEEGDAQPLYLYCNNTSGDGWGWYRFSTSGRNMSIQVLVEGEFPSYSAIPDDFGLIPATVNSNATFNVRFFNSSIESVNSLDYVVTVDGVAGEEQHVAVNPEADKGAFGTFKVTIPTGSEEAKKAIKVEITKINGHDNGASDKVAEGTLGISATQYARNVVIEEFTTENCPNCPRVAGFLHEYFETADRSKVYGVCHHSAFYTDWLTQDCDEELTYLFNDGGATYAPAMMFNREPDFESRYIAGLMDNVTIPSSSTEIGQIVKYYQTETMANAKLEMQVVPNEDKTKVTLNISGEANMSYSTDDALLTVYMTEDNVSARAQSGASGLYYHQHVIRAYNSTWGDQVSWNGNHFTTSYTFDINSSWKKEDLKFVAFLNKHNANDRIDNRIENSIGMSLDEGINAVKGISNDANTIEVARYNAAGQRIYGKQKGLNIVKLSDGRTLKVMEK